MTSVSPGTRSRVTVRSRHKAASPPDSSNCILRRVTGQHRRRRTSAALTSIASPIQLLLPRIHPGQAHTASTAPPPPISPLPSPPSPKLSRDIHPFPTNQPHELLTALHRNKRRHLSSNTSATTLSSRWFPVPAQMWSTAHEACTPYSYKSTARAALASLLRNERPRRIHKLKRNKPVLILDDLTRLILSESFFRRWGAVRVEYSRCASSEFQPCARWYFSTARANNALSTHMKATAQSRT